MARYSITTTLPYVNADPHIGFALEIVQADILARARRSLGDEVFFNTGTDEHGVKIYRKALELGDEPQVYVDRYAARFSDLRKALNLSYDNFIRTTDPAHEAAAQAFWRACEAAGDIYKKKYRVKYCAGCELEKTDSELAHGRCSLHPSTELELIEEENYFFRFSKYQQPLLAFYDTNPDFVIPASRLGEIRAFVARGLEDFSISRLKEKMPWGVAVPGDESQVMYVWFDALVNYISALGYPEARYREWWPSVQVAGKDNLRQQSAMWQAMLLSADVEPSRQIFIHGFITSGGQKMSKSLGNVINPLALVEEYGTDALRYFLARHIHPFEDSDFTHERFCEIYNGNLANGLGNLVARVMKMAEANLTEPVACVGACVPQEFFDALSRFEFNRAADLVWERIGALDQKITDTAPFKLVKEKPEEGRALIAELVRELAPIALMLEPLMPETSEKITRAIRENRMPETLFPRKEK